MTREWDEFLVSVPTEPPRTFVRITPLDDQGQPSGPPVMLNDVIVTLTEQITDLVETFGRILKPAVEGVVTVFSMMWRALFLDPDEVRRYAIEVLDITEADIRTVTDTTIVLWNGRRIPHNLYPRSTP